MRKGNITKMAAVPDRAYKQEIKVSYNSETIENNLDKILLDCDWLHVKFTMAVTLAMTR